MDQKLLIAVDGNSLLFRAFYAISNEMTSSNGVPTGALHGFLMMLSSLMKLKPDYFTVAFDVHQPTFRHLQYKEYKAGRPETPQDLIQQFDVLKSLLKQMHIRVIECPGYEADDILSTISASAGEQKIKTLIVTGDRDALQLVSENTSVLLTKTGITETIEYTPAVLFEKYGLNPEQMKDLKALMGDHSDNIPGIPGVGEKTALKLLSEFHSLEGVLSHAADIKGKLGEKIRENVELAKLSYWLGTISKEAPIDCELSELSFDPNRISDSFQKLRDLGLKQAVSKLSDFVTEPLGDAPDIPEYDQIEISERSSLEDLFSQRKDKPFELAVCMDKILSFAFDPHTSYILKPGETLFDSGLNSSDFFDVLRPYLNSGLKHLICFNAKEIYRCLNNDPIPENLMLDDLMIGWYLQNATKPAQTVRELFTLYYNESALPSAALMFPMWESIKTALSVGSLDELYNQLELPLSKVLYDMESAGVLIDSNALETLSTYFSEGAAKLESEIYEYAGEAFNILSPKQLGQILFDKMGLPNRKKTKSGYSTDADTLEKLIPYSPIIQPVLDYRTLTKLKSTYTDGLRDLINTKDGRVHTSFNQCLTATGRLSSSEPNLQNIPVRTDIGREIRKAFIAKPGYVLIDADYSQIELRLLAHISKDESMIRAFRTGEDIHRRTASEVFNTAYENVSPEQRSAAKAVNFGIIYGISQYGLSENLKIPIGTAKEYIEQYLERYPSIDTYMKKSVAKAKEKGYAETLYGRKRLLPELRNPNFNIRSFGERVAMNMPIQGTAADIIKLAMLSVSKALVELNLDAELILQVHDELIIECRKEQSQAAAEALKAAMENVGEFLIPLTVDVGIGLNWYEAKK